MCITRLRNDTFPLLTPPLVTVRRYMDIAGTVAGVSLVRCFTWNIAKHARRV